MLESMHGGRGRLPNLNTVGRAHCVDEDDPPDTRDYEIDIGNVSHSEAGPSETESSFNINDAEESVKSLRKSFHILSPGGHVCKRNPEHGGVGFIHCRHSMKLASSYAHLRSIMEKQSKLAFMRDCVFRIRSASTYVHELQNLVYAEYRTFYTIRHNCSTDIPVTKLYCLNALCEDLRLHVGHWNAIKQRLHTNRWLQPHMETLAFEIEYVRKTLIQLRDSAIYWLDRLIHIGLEVFAHNDLDRVTHEMLWNITRGLEDFNSAANGIRSPALSSTAQLSYNLHWQIPKHLCSDPLSPLNSNNLGNIISSIRAVPFTKVLNILANERSRYAALETHKFFTINEEFQYLIRTSKLPSNIWNNRQQKSVKKKVSPDTSDYHTATDSMTSLNATMLKVGNVRVPDVSDLMSPLVDFARKEQEFSDKFLLIVCNSTNLLKKNGTHQVRSVRKSTKTPRSPFHLPRGPMGTPVLSRSDSARRKTVSWGDSADSSVRSHLVSRYMDTMWHFFGNNLNILFHEPSWKSENTVLQSEFGSIFLSSDTIVQILCQMMEYVCFKDVFPTGSVRPLLTVSRRLHTSAAFWTWDKFLSSAMGSRTSDKCYPCLLMNNEYSTKTGMFLRDCFQPVLSLLQVYLRDAQGGDKDTGVLTQQDIDMAQLESVLYRLHTTCQVSLSWCSTRSEQYLTLWSVGAFLLVTQTDLKILLDETRYALCLIQEMFSALGLRKDSQQDPGVHMLHANIVSIESQLQSLSGSTMKMFQDKCKQLSQDFFRNSIPQGKSWKKKGTDEFPREANPYVEHALEMILEPVLDGVSKLKLPSQLSVITLATVAMCDAWTNLILKERIKFSLLGAHQLGLDFAFVRTWLMEYVSCDEVRQSVLELAVFRQLNGIIQLLKKQSQKKSFAGLRQRELCSVDDLSCDHSISPEVAGGSGYLAPVPVNDDFTTPIEDNDINCVPNFEEWLALRVHGGTRSWKLASCFASNAGSF